MPRRPLFHVVSILLLVALAACGGGGGAEQDADAGGTEAADAGETEAAEATADTGGAVAGTDTAGVEVGGEPGAKPEITVPDGEPPAELVIADLIEGEGAAAQSGATVTTHYVGVSWSSGEQFDSSWDRGEPISFPLSGVIAGWGEGIPGMKVGGRRLLVIPPEQAYGDQPPPGSGIEPGETLVFVIDLTATQ